MASGAELSPQLRSRICELHSLSYSYTQIHKIHPEVKLSTIKTTCRRENLRVNNTTRPRSGAPRKISEVQRDYIYDIVVNQNPHITNRDLLDEVNAICKERTLQRLLRELGRRKWRQRRRPEIKAHHAQARLEWARQYEHFQAADWKRVKWSDECTVERGVGIQPVWTFLRPSEQLEQGDIKEQRCGKGVKQMFWAAFGYNTRSGLIPLKGDPLSERQGVSGWVIEQLYSAILPDFLEPEDIFMHDGASVHRARVVQTVLQRLGITVMVWPPYSPDLNPIENLWSIMKREIYKLYPELEFADDTEETLEALIEAAKEAWHAIDQAVLDNLSITMPHRVQAVIRAGGWYTKY